MNSELERELQTMLMRNSMLSAEVSAELTIILSKYDVQKKTTEVVIYDNLNCNEQIIQRYLLAKTAAGRTERTVQAYRRYLTFILRRVNKPFNLITSDDIKLYLAFRKVREKKSDIQLENEWRVLSGFYGWLHREEIISTNPMFKVDKPKTRKKKKHAFTEMECEIMRNGCRNNRDKAIIEVLLSTWCRVSEVVNMNISDIEGDQVTVVGKGNKERTVYLNSKAQLAISEYLEEREDLNNALFVSLQKPHERLKSSGIEIILRKLGKECGVEKVHPHRFRRTGATMALKKGMPIYTVSALLGHESIETTQIYLDVNEEETKIAHRKWVV